MESYYKSELENTNERIKKFQSKFNEVKSLSTYYIVVAKLTLEKIHMEYMLGSSKESLKILAAEYTDLMRRYSEIPEERLSYNQVVNTLTLALLFDIQNVDFVQGKMIEEKYVDAVCDLLRNKVFSHTVLNTKTFYLQENGYFSDEFRKSEKGLLLVINENEPKVRNELFLTYLNTTKDKYHKKMMKYYDKLTENRYTYVGSYDFVLTAVAKILEIDKELLKDNKYIAYDLL